MEKLKWRNAEQGASVDKISKEKRSKVMRSIKSVDTKPEERLRKALFSKGYRYRKHHGEHKIDIAFPSRKIAIFVDGCFWHMCPKHGKLPKSNKRYWTPKLKRNVERDKKINAHLKKTGWKVIRIWECEILESTTSVVNTIFKKLPSY